MATSSITKNFVISGQKQVEMFADAIEASFNNPTPPINVSATFLTDAKDIAKGEDTLRQVLSEFSCRVNKDVERFNLAAYLIAQLGKNYNNGANERISGKELLGLAIRQIQQLQYLAGGMVIFLEAANEEKLLSFYRENGFQQFDTRLTDSSKGEPHELIQLLKLF